MLIEKRSLITRTAILIILSILPFHAYGEEQRISVYTVQIASSRDLDATQKQFDTIVDKLNKESLAYLRIEKVGKFYPLRLGKFDTISDAKKFLKSVKAHLPSSIVMKVYYIEERIERIYETAGTEAEPQQTPLPEDRKTGQTYVPDEAKQKETAKVKPPVTEIPDEVKLPEVKKPDDIERDVPLDEKIASISSLVHNKDYDGALEIIKAEIKEEPDNAELNAWYGTLLLKTDKPEEALPYLKNATAISPSVPDYHNGLGYCYFYLEEDDNAIEAFHKALSLEPEHVDALAGLGIVYAKNGKKEEAIGIYDRLKNLDEGSADKLLKIIEGPQQ